ncbi:MAG TPA: glycosyltransferase family 39 protein [Holophaga sp.]|nr:glycosyltransferase family 39 protein [Holophaga sp.]
MNVQPVFPFRKWTLGDLLACLLPFLFMLAVACMCLKTNNFELNPDEGGNLMKALLVGRGHPLYVETWSDQPPLFTHALALLFKVTGPSVESGRMLVVVASGLLLWGVFQHARLAGGTATAVGGLVLVACLPYYLKLSCSVMIGLPALACAVLSLAAHARWRRTRMPGLLAASSALLALSVLIKGFTLVLLPAVALGMLLDRELGTFRERMSGLLLWVGVFAGVALSMVLVLVGPGNLDQLITTHWKALRTDACGGTTLRSSLRHTYPVLLLAAGGGCTAWRRRNLDALYVALWAFLAAGVLLFHRPLWNHQQLLLSVPSAMLAAELVTDVPRLWHHLSRRNTKWPGRLAAGLLLTLGLALAGAHVRFAVRTAARWMGGNDRIKHADDWNLVDIMARRAGATNWVVTDRPIYAFRAGLLVPPEMAVLSRKRVFTERSGDGWMLACLRRYRPEQVALARFPWAGLRPYLEVRYRPGYQRSGRDLFLLATPFHSE